MKEFAYHNIGPNRTLSSIWYQALGANTFRFKVAYYFLKKVSILDAWQGPKYAPGRKMTIAK